MIKHFTIFFLLMCSFWTQAQQVVLPNEAIYRYPGHVLVILSDSSMRFEATLNGIKQNHEPLFRLRLIEIYRNKCSLRIDFENKELQPIV